MASHHHEHELATQWACFAAPWRSTEASGWDFGILGSTLHQELPSCRAQKKLP